MSRLDSCGSFILQLYLGRLRLTFTLRLLCLHLAGDHTEPAMNIEFSREYVLIIFVFVNTEYAKP